MGRLGRAAGLGRMLLLALAFALAAGEAFADLRAFNAAVKAGDYKTAAAEARTIWPTWDKMHEDTALLAREFGLASYIAGDYAAARLYGEFLRDRGPNLPAPDDQPASSRVLLAVANFRLDGNDATRTALFDALKARERVKGIDNLSVLAAEALYKADAAASAWSRESESADLAFRLLNRAGATLAPRALEARAAAAVAGFLSGPDKEDYDRIADAYDAAIDLMNATLEPARRQAFAPLFYQLQAWTRSVESSFGAAEHEGSNLAVKVKPRKPHDLQQPVFPEPEQPAPLCQSVLARRPNELTYPAAAQFKGVTGTVILKLQIDSEGKVTRVETLAAVPGRQFAPTVEQFLAKAQFKRSEADDPGCSLAREARVFTWVFAIA